MGNVESGKAHDSGILRRQIECVGQLAASTVLVEQGLGAALQEITEAAARALNVDRISLWQHDALDGEATCLEAFDRRARRHEEGAVLQLAQHQAHLAELKRRHVLAVDDTSLDKQAAAIHRDVLDPMSIKAILLVSIRREGRFIGSLACSKLSGPHHWTAEEQAFAGVFAEFVSRSLETHERRNAETAFKDFADAASDWFWETDTEHRFTYVSDKFFKLTGETPDDVIGKTRSESQREIDDPVLANEFLRVLAAHETFRDVINARTFPDGKRQWYRISGVPVFDENDKFKGYRGVGTDVTEHIRMERALQEREANFSALVDAAPLPITVTVDGMHVYGNALAYGLLGVSQEEFDGMGAHQIYVNREDQKSIVAELEARGRIRNREVLLQRKDGVTFWTSLNANIADFQGKKAYITGFTDITERRTAQEELAKTASLLEAILDAVPGGLTYRDLDGRIQFMNKQGAAILDRPANEFIGKTLTEIFGDVDGITTETLVSRVIETGKPILNHENAPPRVSGRTFNFSVVPVQDQNDTMVGVVTSTDEITARKQADDQLRRSEARFRNVVENSIQGVCIEREDRILFANQALANIFGYETPEDIIALVSTEKLLPPEEAKRIRKFNELRSRGDFAPEHYRAQGQRRDGTVIWLDIMINTVDWDGEAAVQATVVDVTAEVEAATGREQLADALEHFPESVVLFDQDDRLIFQNAAYRQSYWQVRNFNPYGCTFEEILRKSAESGYVPEAEGRVEEWLQERLAAHREKISPVRVRRMGKEEIWQDIYDVTTQGGGSLMLLVDATKLHQQEDLLREAQKMETVGQLTGGVAHDFNNILAVIQGNHELIDNAIDPDSRLHRFLAPAARATTRGADLTHRLLAFVRRQPLKMRAADLADLIRNMDGMLKSSLGETISTSLICEPGLWHCNVDPTQLEQAILNLAVNARDAMPDGGKLTFQVCNSTIEAQMTARQLGITPGEYVLLTVSDDGSGMPQEVSEKIFEPFFTTKDVGQGTGLGLSMVFGLVKQSFGHISVASEVGVGTTFKIFLPRAREEADPDEPDKATEAPEARPGEVILVVEDDEAVRTLVVTLLEDLGYDVVQARDGASAQTQWQGEGRIDLILSDVVLPGGMSGPDIAFAARQHRADLKVLYMSGYTDDAVVHHGQLDAEVELLQKPFAKAELAQRLRLILDR